MTEQQEPTELNTQKLPEVLPILPLFDAALFPKMVLPLVVMQDESIQLIDEAMSKDRLIGLLVAKKKSDQVPYPKQDLSTIGTSALILKMAKTEDKRAQLLVQGLSRFEVTAFQEDKPYLEAQIKHIEEMEQKDNPYV